ncbi:MAG: 23S rRNA (guanosine(2251)-2'-O)-methyltransferase RlmB [Actinobacteria bacterium]|nr:23S rRNA (guanosine(2251)-2'-O)-methyltransferase RlmB [Actinomycetota bacterium]
MELIYGRHVVALALAPGARRPVRHVFGTSAALRAAGIDRHAGRVRVTEVGQPDLDELVGSGDHQGLVAEVGPYRYADIDEVLAGDLVVALDEVTDPRNLGAVARTALACGAAGIVVTRHRSAPVSGAAVKASAGATEHLPIAQVTNLRRALQQAQQRGFWVYGASGAASQSYLDVDLPERVVLVLGSEGRGLRRLTAESCDELLALPMAGPVSSLNVSVAAAVLLYDVRRRRTAPEAGR